MNRRFPRDSRNSRQGMVLLEVVVALTIFSMVALSLVLALQAAFDVAKERNEIDVVLRGLQNQMALVHGARVDPNEKDVPDDGSGVTYHISIAPEQMQDQKQNPVEGIMRVTITAKWQSNGQDEDRSLSELIYQP